MLESAQVPPPVRIIGAVTPIKKTSTSLLNLGYPVWVVLALFVWNLLFIIPIIWNVHKPMVKSNSPWKWEQLIEQLPIFAVSAVIITGISLLLTAPTVKKCGCGVLSVMFFLSTAGWIIFEVGGGEWKQVPICSVKNSSKFCLVRTWTWTIGLAMIYSFGSAFLWRRDKQESIRQLCCPGQPPEDIDKSIEHNVEKKSIEYTLSVVVKSDLSITGLKLQISDNDDKPVLETVVDLTMKRSVLTDLLPTFVGSVEIQKPGLVPDTNYKGRVVDEGPFMGDTFTFTTQQLNGEQKLNSGRKKRIVRLGRKWLLKCGCCWLPCFHHWAVQVDDGQHGWWYEVGHKEILFTLPNIRVNKVSNNDRRMFIPCCKKDDDVPNETNVEMGCCDERDAGCCGGEIVGKTIMTDEEIEVFYETWSKEKKYFAPTTNCIKFAYELIEKLTNGKFLISHSTVVAANVSENSRITSTCIKWVEGDGTALGRCGAGDTRFTYGLFGLRCRFGPEFKAQCLAGLPGLGLFLNLSCSRVEFSILFPCIGGDLHADININTGVGARNGNIEAHFLGFGGKVGTDGIELNTPWFGGYNIGAIFVWLSYMYIIHPESGVTLSTFLQNVIKKI